MPASAILLAIDGPQTALYEALLREQAGSRELRVWPDRVGDTHDIAYACVWKPPHGLLADFPNLKAIFNLGAGVDHVLADPALPDVALVRAVHRDLSMRVTEYVVLHALMFHRRQRLYDAQQRARLWKGHDQPAAGEVAVGVMGLGAIGMEAASVLVRIGFDVAGWSRTPKSLAGIRAFHGQAGLDAFLARTEILVCLLPATPQTDGILALPLLRKLKCDGAAGGAFLINAGRGTLQVDTDIISALDEGTLAGAALDVFPQEPLPVDSPFWSHPKVTVTPHNAGDISPAILVADVVRQIGRLEQGLALDHVVERVRHY